MVSHIFWSLCDLRSHLDWLETWLLKQPSWSKFSIFNNSEHNPLTGQPSTLDVFIRKKGEVGPNAFAFEEHDQARAGPDAVRYQPSMGK